MRNRWLVLFVICLLACNQLALAADSPLIQYDFSRIGEGGVVTNQSGEQFAGKLAGEARALALPDAKGGSVLSLDGASGYVAVPGSAGLHIGETGFTILATVRMAETGNVEGQPPTHDMILFKDQQYLFGRSHQRLYFNLHNGKDWVGGVLGGDIRPGVWYHTAVIVERINEPPQGRVGYHIRLFLNGEMVAGREVLNCTGATTDNDINVGKGWGGPWFLKGDMAHVTVYPRALTESELNQYLKQEKLAKVIFRPTPDPDPRYLPQVAQTRQAVAAVTGTRARSLKQLLAAVTQATHHTDSEAKMLPALATVQRLAQGKDANPVAAFLKAHTAFQFLDNGRLAATFFSPRPGVTVLCSLFDLAAGREVFGEQREFWTLGYDRPGSTELVRLNGAAPSWTSTVTLNRAARTAVLRWQHRPTEDQPFAGEVRSEVRLTGSRLTMNLVVDNRSPKVALREVRFPQFRLQRLSEGTDNLLVPRMSGVVHPNPIGTHFRYDGPYPSGAAHMQFFAYYDDRQGVYVGLEDGKGRSKNLLAGAADKDCEMLARWFVGCPGEGGNGFASSGVAALEVYQGDWFEAAKIYQRFTRTAAWWPSSRTRQDTPAWLREMTVWFLGNANSQGAVEALLKQRQYLGLPIALHWYNWNTEKFDDDYPHFTPRDGIADTVARLQAAGVYCKPYINARLWEHNDRGEEDYQFTSVALPATLKQRDGKPYVESYAKRFFSPMCPTTPVWQKTMLDLCTQVAGHGVAAIYLDQVAAARPQPCFDRSHPHVPGSGEAWLEQGYWPMMKRIRQQLQAKHPELAFCSEDAAEPYMHVFDSYLPWRFLDIGHVPAFQAVYAGRIQMTSRHFDDSSYEALFPKAAEQMLYGEQIGWFNMGTFSSNAAFQPFVKKLAHTRKTFLAFFNEGEMLKPGQYAEPPATLTCDWGFYGPRIITQPAVLHSVWGVEDSVLVLLTNTTAEPQTIQFRPRPAAWGLTGRTLAAVEYQEGQAPATLTWNPAEARRLTVPGYGLAAWLLTSGSPAAPRHAARLAAARELFAALSRFDDEASMTPERKLAELTGRNPWIVPEAPLLKPTDWIAAAAAPKLVRARAADGGAYVGWIGDGGSLGWGLVDFGEATGKPVIEVEVAVPATSTSGRLQVYRVADGKGHLWAETPLKPTGDYQTYGVVRLPLPPDVAGQHALVLQVRGSGGGICNIKRWRLVREP
jgi:hypothetical protein